MIGRYAVSDKILDFLQKEYDNFNNDGVGDYEVILTAIAEIGRLRRELAFAAKWMDNYKLAFEDSQKTVKHWYGVAKRLHEEGRCRHCNDYPAVFHKECIFRDFDEIANG